MNPSTARPADWRRWLPPDTLALHLLRGVLGIAAFAAAIRSTEAHPWAALGLLVLAVLALRGCPVCWLVGLIERLARRRGSAPQDLSIPVETAAQPRSPPT